MACEIEIADRVTISSDCNAFKIILFIVAGME